MALPLQYFWTLGSVLFFNLLYGTSSIANINKESSSSDLKMLSIRELQSSLISLCLFITTSDQFHIAVFKIITIFVSPPEKKDTVLRQVRLDPCDLQPIFDDMLHILNPEELHVIEEIPAAEDKLDQLFEIAGVKSQEASQTLLDSVYSHLPDLL